MIGRLSNNPKAQGFIASTTKGKNWVHELENAQDTETILQRTEENPFLPPEYIASLRRQYTSEFSRQELDADIVEFGSGVINSAWFQLIDNIKLDESYRPVRFWDLAVSMKTAADYTAGALCSFQNERFVIHDIMHGKFEYPDLRKRLIETANRDGRNTIIAVEEAGQQRGFIDDLKRLPELREFTIVAQAPEGDKFNRMMPWASRAQLGNVQVCRGLWNKEFFDECNDFTADDSHAHDDQIDAVSGAYHKLVQMPVPGLMVI